MGSPKHPRAGLELNEMLQSAALFNEDHLVVACVLTEPPETVEGLARISNNALFFLGDYDKSISRAYGALEMPRTVVLDPMQRAIADIAWDNPQGHAETVRTVLNGLPAVDESAGVPLFPPALIVPRVFGYDLCDFLIQFYEEQNAADSGFQVDVGGKTATIVDYKLKRRNDVGLGAPEVRELVRSHMPARCCRRSSRISSSRRRGWTAASSPATTPMSAATSTAIATTSMPAPSIGALPSRSISTRISTAAT